MRSIDGRPRGRPNIPPAQRTVNVSVTLRPAQVAWLRQRGVGLSVAVRSLVAKAMQEAAKSQDDGIANTGSTA